MDWFLFIAGMVVGMLIVNAIWWFEHCRTVRAWQAEEESKQPSGNEVMKDDQR